MKKQIISLIGIISLTLLAACGGPKEVQVEVKPLGNQMKYETTQFEVKAGQKVTLIMNNTASSPAMKHNVVILTDKNAVQEIGTAAITAKDHLPDHPAIYAATPLADAGQTTSVTFTAPEKKGNYLYICTYPGHYMMMQGTMIVK